MGKGGGVEGDAEEERQKEEKVGRRQDRNMGDFVIQPPGCKGPLVLPQSGS